MRGEHPLLLALPLARAAPTAPPSRAAHGVPADAPCFGILGKLQGWKGQLVFLRAARRVLDAHPKARAWIVGDAPAGEEGFAKGRPLNHIGVEVDDLDAVEARVIAAGLLPFNHGDYDPGRRFYFLDPDGIEYEVVSYR